MAEGWQGRTKRELDTKRSEPNSMRHVAELFLHDEQELQSSI